MAELAYFHAANMIPHKFYPKYLLAKLYEVSGNVEQAKEMALIILEKEIKVQSPAVQEMKQEMEKLLKQ